MSKRIGIKVFFIVEVILIILAIQSIVVGFSFACFNNDYYDSARYAESVAGAGHQVFVSQCEEIYEERQAYVNELQCSWNPIMRMVGYTSGFMKILLLLLVIVSPVLWFFFVRWYNLGCNRRRKERYHR